MNCWGLFSQMWQQASLPRLLDPWCKRLLGLSSPPLARHSHLGLDFLLLYHSLIPLLKLNSLPSLLSCWGLADSCFRTGSQFCRLEKHLHLLVEHLVALVLLQQGLQGLALSLQGLPSLVFLCLRGGSSEGHQLWQRDLILFEVSVPSPALWQSPGKAPLPPPPHHLLLICLATRTPCSS